MVIKPENTQQQQQPLLLLLLHSYGTTIPVFLGSTASNLFMCFRMTAGAVVAAVHVCAAWRICLPKRTCQNAQCQKARAKTHSVKTHVLKCTVSKRTCQNAQCQNAHNKIHIF